MYEPCINHVDRQTLVAATAAGSKSKPKILCAEELGNCARDHTMRLEKCLSIVSVLVSCLSLIRAVRSICCHVRLEQIIQSVDQVLEVEWALGASAAAALPR